MFHAFGWLFDDNLLRKERVGSEFINSDPEQDTHNSDPEQDTHHSDPDEFGPVTLVVIYTLLYSITSVHINRYSSLLLTYCISNLYNISSRLRENKTQILKKKRNNKQKIAKKRKQKIAKKRVALQLY